VHRWKRGGRPCGYPSHTPNFKPKNQNGAAENVRIRGSARFKNLEIPSFPLCKFPSQPPVPHLRIRWGDSRLLAENGICEAFSATLPETFPLVPPVPSGKHEKSRYARNGGGLICEWKSRSSSERWAPLDCPPVSIRTPGKSGRRMAPIAASRKNLFFLPVIPAQIPGREFVTERPSPPKSFLFEGGGEQAS